ncbi:hypothetical protein JD844_006580 [Phrynosoma platyrhinos]|uniref:Cyclin-like domain-containing protein n=1 Tax=Phrynosoma platyrhinos TaxID=52577 RepID=A0ABQ7T296_PHRPL|nr:hypothetical protein JD844_006580 [Phrynosoma platyrhinos]
MELEGQWWKGQLAADIHQALRYKELKLPSYKGQSPQLNLRRYFADLIAIVSNRFRLCPAARHLAVYLLDLFMDRYDISIQQLHVVALSCLLLASKFEEKEDSVPKLEQLNSLGCMTNMNLVLTKQSLLHMELLLLETFQWNLCLPTAAHFIDYYLSIAVHESDLHDGWPMVCLEKTKLAHDNDVKEANKQKGQHVAQAAQPSLFQTATQSPQQHIPQYIQAHQTPLQYPQTATQQNCQQIVSSGPTSTYPLHACPSGLQAGVQPRGHIQTATGMSLAVPIEVKPCLSVSYNRSYQIAGRYPCITPCFER